MKRLISNRTKLLSIAISVAGLLAISPVAQAQVLYMSFDNNLSKAVKAMNKGDMDRASKYFHKANRANLSEEHKIATLTNICAVDYVRGDLETALEACDESLSIDRMNWRGYVNRGNVLSARGDYDRAQKDYQKALKIKPNSTIANAAYTHFQATLAENKSTKILAKAQ